jgi:hypothetical protein
MTPAPKTRDYFAEMYVAGILADSGWNIYFPRRDRGFDFIITKTVEAQVVVRPVQVKGKYPQANKSDDPAFGYMGRITEFHPDMVLAIAFLTRITQAVPRFISRTCQGHRFDPSPRGVSPAILDDSGAGSRSRDVTSRNTSTP